MAGSVAVLDSKPHYTGTTKVVKFSPLPYAELDKYYKVKIKTYRAGVAVIDKKTNNLLMVHQLASNNWGVPKGHRDANESDALQTATRELLEESGITAGEFSPWVIMLDLKYTNGVDLHVYYILPVDTVPEVNIDAAELGSYKWVGLSEADRLQMSRPMELLIHRLREGRPKV